MFSLCKRGIAAKYPKTRVSFQKTRIHTVCGCLEGWSFRFPHHPPDSCTAAVFETLFFPLESQIRRRLGNYRTRGRLNTVRVINISRIFQNFPNHNREITEKRIWPANLAAVTCPGSLFSTSKIRNQISLCWFLHRWSLHWQFLLLLNQRGPTTCTYQYLRTTWRDLLLYTVVTFPYLIEAPVNKLAFLPRFSHKEL